MLTELELFLILTFSATITSDKPYLWISSVSVHTSKQFMNFHFYLFNNLIASIVP